MNTKIQIRPSQTLLQSGTMLRGAYRIDGVFGKGGFAVVYKALQVNLRRHVAIKVLNPVLDTIDGESMVRRFLQEATAAANIRHSNVVMIHDVGFLEDRRPYIVMEPFDGHDIREHLRNHGPLAPRRWLPLVCDCLGALAKAHQLSIIHRDIKPGNLVLTDPGTQDESLKLIDFGIARLLNDQVNLTSESQRIGTMRYMAPEYITSNIVSPMVDVFQMGLILVEGLTGQPVIQGRNDGQCVHMITRGTYAVPEALRASPLGPIIKKALKVNPSSRFPHAGAMRAALLKVNPDDLLGLDLVSAASPRSYREESTTVDSVDILYISDTNTHHQADTPSLREESRFDLAVKNLAVSEPLALQVPDPEPADLFEDEPTNVDSVQVLSLCKPLVQQQPHVEPADLFEDEPTNVDFVEVLYPSRAHALPRRTESLELFRSSPTNVDPVATLYPSEPRAQQPRAELVSLFNEEPMSVDFVEVLYPPVHRAPQSGATPLDDVLLVPSPPEILFRPPSAVFEAAEKAKRDDERRAQRLWMLVACVWVMGLCLLIVAGYLLWGAQSPSSTSPLADAPPDAAPSTPQLVTFEVEPEHATIRHGDKVLGTGLAQLEAPDEVGATLTLRVEAEGYEGQQLSLSAPFEPSNRVVLKPVTRNAPPVRPTTPAEVRPSTTSEAPRAVTRKAPPARAAAPTVKKTPAVPKAKAPSTTPPTKRKAKPSAKKAPATPTPVKRSRRATSSDSAVTRKPAPRPATPTEKKPVKKAPKPVYDLTFDIID